MNPAKAFAVNRQGILRVSQACGALAHAKFDVDDQEQELTRLLDRRRKVYIKPIHTDGPPKFILIGQPGIDGRNRTPVWEGFELALDVGPHIQIFAKKGPTVEGQVDVRVLEIGDP